MSKFWRHSGDALEAELRALRPEPRPEFSAMLADRVRSERRGARGGSFRLAFAGVLTAAMVTSLAAFGGLGYAASGVTHVAKSVVQLVSPTKKIAPLAVGSATSGSDQYRPGYGFGDPNHVHTGPPGQNKKGGPFAPPLTPACHGAVCTLSTTVTIDEQAHEFISVLIGGKKIPIIQRGSRFGGPLEGVPAKTLNYLVLIPGSRLLKLNIPRSLVPAAGRGQIRLIARDPDGNKSTLLIPFTI
ncbi:MAG: hypothetical protein E6G08_00605 [Actinobacteria bacterium]|nr:MAG: hypothetical protein E6G08_00605 [Actinomycetota bacterium]